MASSDQIYDKLDTLAGTAASILTSPLPAGANLIGVVESVPNARRNAGVLHRNAITAIDKVANYTAANFTVANVAGTQGSLVFNTTYYVTGCPGNRWGPTAITAAIDSILVTSDAVSTHVVNCALAQAAGAEWYDLFLSVDAAPKWVGRITEAQRAAGGFEILTVGVVTVNAAVPAGYVYIGVVGTGIQTSNAVFSVNNAYRPDTVTAINCAGYSIARVKAKLALTDLRSAPALSLIPFFGNQVSATDFHAGTAEALILLSSVGYPLCQEFEVNVRGETKLVLLVGAISGQGAAASIWVELS